jgi:hypothetical protein
MSQSLTSGYLPLKNLPKIAVGLNIEGYRPTLNLPPNCKWYNIIQAIDEPLEGTTFDDVMASVKSNNYSFIEQAVGIDIEIYLEQVIGFIQAISKHHSKVLVHVHQYTGTTKLAEVIQERTHIKTILDTTNFFETPIIYSEVYPQLDALISISQCAGLGTKAGEWIIPTNFLQFDVKHNIIYTTPQVALNEAAKYVNFPCTEGPILMVNDLWNPELLSCDHNSTPLCYISKPCGILLFDNLDTRVYEFCKESTQIFDDTHNHLHALEVARDATFIRNTKRTLHLALLHDVCDHKYPNSIPRSALSDFITANLTDYESIDPLISKVSFTYSKQHPNEAADPDLEVVRDADRLNALGVEGVRRCIGVTTLRGGKVPDDVIVHCYDKLLKLLPENYIVTPLGRSMAVPLHNVIVKYVKDHLSETKLSFAPPEYISNM